MKLGIVMDDIDTINPTKDTSFAILLAAQQRGIDCYYMKAGDISCQNTQVFSNMRQITVKDQPQDFYTLQPAKSLALNSLDVLFIRKDPPFDESYLMLTYLLELAGKQGLTILNQPRSLRDANEKIFTQWFPHLCPDTLITSSTTLIEQFLQKHTTAIIKPVDGMGGHSIFKLTQGDPNIPVILDTITLNNSRTVVAQEYIPQISDSGDKRILMINGKPISHALARIPAKNDFRGNIAAGATYQAVPLTEQDHYICQQIGPTLKEKGLFFVGIDIIGNYLTEINVTSPTCVRELDRLCGLDIAGDLLDAVATRISEPLPS